MFICLVISRRESDGQDNNRYLYRETIQKRKKGRIIHFVKQTWGLFLMQVRRKYRCSRLSVTHPMVIVPYLHTPLYIDHGIFHYNNWTACRLTSLTLLKILGFKDVLTIRAFICLILFF